MPIASTMPLATAIPLADKVPLDDTPMSNLCLGHLAILTCIHQADENWKIAVLAGPGPGVGVGRPGGAVAAAVLAVPAERWLCAGE